MPRSEALPASFWALPADELLAALESSGSGLTEQEATRRQALARPERRPGRDQLEAAELLLRQYTSPIVLLLIGASTLSFLLQDPIDGGIILVIVLVSGLLGFWQERGAAIAVQRLLQAVESRSRVLRSGEQLMVPSAVLVPGDIVLLVAGSSIPADCRVLEAQALAVDQAPITGESTPVEKRAAVLPLATPMARRVNTLYLGTHVVSGSGTAVVVRTGKATEMGAIAEHLQQRSGPSEFEQGVRRFGDLLLELTMLLVLFIFAFNIYLQRPFFDSFMFALALAVGLTPQLLPAVIAVNLARGARRMADRQVIVKRLSSIEDFGSMTVLCSDKTGTLTEGVVQVEAAIDAQGRASRDVAFHAWLNASLQAGFPNPIDTAILGAWSFDLAGWHKRGEIPYDFRRKRLSILAEGEDGGMLVTKGALRSVLACCAEVMLPEGPVPIAAVQEAIERLYADHSARGLRTLGVACRPLDPATPLGAEIEIGLRFLGLLVLADPLKPDIATTLRDLAALGVKLKMITGDNALVAARVGREVGLDGAALLTGAEVAACADNALPVRARATDIFAEVEPNQKERIIRALRRGGDVVGYLGDGINDGPALHAADVGLSVQGAADVAREAADLVLLAQDLEVLVDGIREGRRTFANTLKYVFIATSANFGNMFSMAAASLFLPFLPLLPKQILLTNLLTDLPEMTIATDRVDRDWVERPRRWDIHFIRNFMLTFGFVSSLFDVATFAVLILVLHAGPAEFRSGWFLESVTSASLIVLVVRTRGPLLAGRPSRSLVLATIGTILATLLLPYTSLGRLFGFAPLPGWFLLPLALILLAYVLTAEAAKRLFYGRLREG